IKKLTKIGIATTPLVAYGKRGCNPASQQSFLVTEDLGDIISVEELCEKAGKHLWQGKSAKFKHELLQKMAELAAKLHGAGLCHRDFYLCQLVLKKADLMAGNLHLYLIDLHRMANGCSANGSEVMKDIAAFYFSAKLNGFSDQDLMVFRQHYLVQSAVFWQRVEARADSLLVKFNSDKFQAKIANERAKLG
ncbi:MAG: lipopolysaccharide kinase InaA family protein, partial [Methylophilaceae bacterium]